MQFAKRKWGRYLTLLDRGTFKIKLLRFQSGKACSLQYHEKRSELWLFLKGLGTMEIQNQEPFNIAGGKWAKVDCGRSHRFSAAVPTYVIEIQYGEICEESDIVRL